MSIIKADRKKNTTACCSCRSAGYIVDAFGWSYPCNHPKANATGKECPIDFFQL